MFPYAQRMWEILVERGFRPGELARKAGVGSNYIQVIVYGQRTNTALATAKRFADALNVNVWWLLGHAVPRDKEAERDGSLFTQRFQECLLRSGLSQSAMGRELGMPASTINDYFSGVRMYPKHPTAKRFADLFGVNVWWLLGYDVPEDKAAEAETEREFLRPFKPQPLPPKKLIVEVEEERSEERNREEFDGLRFAVTGYARLNNEARGIIRGMIKRLLKAPKYQERTRV